MLSHVTFTHEEWENRFQDLSYFNLEFDLLADQLSSIKERKKKIEIAEKSISERLQLLCKNVSHVSSMYAYISEEKKGSVNYSKIPALRGVNLEDYRKENVKIWKLSKQPTKGI